MYASDINMAIDELNKNSPDNDIYRVCAEVNSPFIEHIMQKYIIVIHSYNISILFNNISKVVVKSLSSTPIRQKL